MSRTPINPHAIDWSGENPAITLKSSPDGETTCLVSFFRVVVSPHGPGHAVFVLTDLSRANMEAALLDSANLTNTDLRGAHLRNAELTRVKFENAQLQGVDLEGASVAFADFRKADRPTPETLAVARDKGKDVAGVPDGWTAAERARIQALWQ